MRPSAAIIPASTWFGFILALFVWGLVSPQAARGCTGHYVTDRSGLIVESAGLELLSEAGAIPSKTVEVPPKPPAPCQGAFCSENPVERPVSTQPLPIRFADNWAVSVVRLSFDSPVSRFSWNPDSTHSLIDRSSTIFHPPRGASPTSPSSTD